MIFRLLAALLLVAIPGTAMAYTQTQENVLNNVAELIAIDRLCPRMTANKLLASTAMVMHGLESDAAFDEMSRRMRAKEKELAKNGEDVICLTGEALYGKDGAKIPGALTPD